MKEKFSDFKNFLLREKNSFYLSLEEIELIIGQHLCKSAYAYKQYWYPTKTHTFAVLIYECGFEIEADIKHPRIKLTKK